MTGRVPVLARASSLIVLAAVVASCSSNGRSSSHASNSTSATASTTTVSTLPSPSTSTSSSTTTTKPATTTTTTRPATDAQACVAALPLSTRVGQLVMAPVPADPGGVEVQAFAARQLGGAILMTAVGVDAASVSRLRDGGRIPLFVAVDEEGGSVQRLASLAGPLPSEQVAARTMTPTAAQQMIADHARKVAALGVNVVFAPVVDVAPLTGDGPLGTRAFGSAPDIVTDYAHAYIEGWRLAGVLPVLKHFPGLGSATGNTDQVPAHTPPLAALERRDTLPYETLAHRSRSVGVMMSNAAVPGLTDGPATLAPAAYSLLRQRARFLGVVFTDSLDARAVVNQERVPTAAVDAIAAGADQVVLTVPGQSSSVIAALTAAVGTRIPSARVDDAVLRILTTKHVDPCTLAR